MEGLARRNQDVFVFVFVNVDFRHQRVRGAKNTSFKTYSSTCTGMKVLRLTCSHSQNTITTVVEA